MSDLAGDASYVGRLAPTPSGEFHLGHARTFDQVHRRARRVGGTLILRIEDLDAARCKPAFEETMMADFAWMGLSWDAGPFYQSQRRDLYVDAWRKLLAQGLIYPCKRTRRELRDLVRAPHEEEEAAEVIYPPSWRPPPGAGQERTSPAGVAWRFRVPDGEVVRFEDVHHGWVSYTAGVDFGDFGIWRRDDVPAYELAVVVDDLAMGVTEVVRGADLLKSTARQLLLYRALGGAPPAWCHEALVRDAQGRRLAKRSGDVALRVFREQGMSFEAVMARLRAPGMVSGIAGNPPS